MEHCRTEQDFRKLIEASAERPAFLLKHSLTCGVSAMAREDYQDFDADTGAYRCWELTVQTSRDLSRLVAEETGVRHESPQVLLFRDGKVLWHASHGQIRLAKLREALADATA